MSHELTALVITAASMGFLHTLFGPDHYLPFIVISKARKWSLIKTSIITFICGTGHIMSSVLLGSIGILLGLAVKNLVAIESVRGELAGWLLITFGLVYFIWGLKHAVRKKPHKHIHLHSEGTEHSHNHMHTEEHLHVHQDNKANITPWVLFIIFVFGPCEPLIPILMYPAAKGSIFGLILVTSVFGLTTLATMMSIVLISSFGISFLPMKALERYTHALAGATICFCGVAIQFLGL